MTTIPLTDCCTMLGINPKTLRHWLHQAQMPLHVHPTDARIKCLTREQVQQLAVVHARPLTLPEALAPSPLVLSSPLSAEIRQRTPIWLSFRDLTVNQKRTCSKNLLTWKRT